MTEVSKPRQIIERVKVAVNKWLVENNPTVIVDGAGQRLLYVDPAGNIILPQRADKHEYDVFRHSEVAMGYVEDVYNVLIPQLSKDAQNKLRDSGLLEGLANHVYPAAVAAYIHDIDKFFKPRSPYKQSDPLAKPQGEKVDLNDSLAVVNEITQILEEIEPERLGSLGPILYIYKMVDRKIVTIAESGEDPSSHTDGLVSEIKNVTNNKSLAIWGVLLMIADNLAQGNPPDADESFQVQVNKNIQFCQSLIERILIS